jgi:galactitol-specific phosphotransferase system IIC component
MQRTRLATLIESASTQFGRWVFNPWRRLSLVVIGLLFGNFLGIAISSIAGQAAELDVVISAILLILVEFISWLVYRRPPQSERRQNNLLIEVLNALKIGLIYSLFVEAFKLGS